MHLSYLQLDIHVGTWYYLTLPRLNLEQPRTSSLSNSTVGTSDVFKLALHFEQTHPAGPFRWRPPDLWNNLAATSTPSWNNTAQLNTHTWRFAHTHTHTHMQFAYNKSSWCQMECYSTVLQVQIITYKSFTRNTNLICDFLRYPGWLGCKKQSPLRSKLRGGCLANPRGPVYVHLIVVQETVRSSYGVTSRRTSQVLSRPKCWMSGQLRLVGTAQKGPKELTMSDQTEVWD